MAATIWKFWALLPTLLISASSFSIDLREGPRAIANPEATQRDGFIRWLVTECIAPLPEYLIDNIRASWDTRTYRAALEMQMGQEHLRMSEAAYTPVEMPYIGHDAFIASFWLVEPPGVGITEPVGMNLNVTLLSDDGHFLVRMPAAIAWQLELYDALGKRLDMQRMNDERFFIDLSTRASGAYLLRATDANGQVFTAKLIRP